MDNKPRQPRISASDATESNIMAAIESWHQGDGAGLHEYLGWSPEEYTAYVEIRQPAVMT